MSKFLGEKPPRKFAILGAGGHSRVVADTAECCGWTDIEFFDDNWPSTKFAGHWAVVGDTQTLLARFHEFDGVIVAIGNNEIRRLKMDELSKGGIVCDSLVHPSATISRYATLGAGVVAFAGVVVNAGVKIGDGAILNTGCSIDHDCVLDDCVHVSPGARIAGAVQVGRMSWIGIGACIRQEISIGAKVTVGAGAAVVNNITDGVTVVGVPARALSK
ncbi:acetyltransferase [Pseudomonas psychrophila]|uniref:acetyltransferase n=1 Tax=Pseudomonas psychrophila TaxID=122355 RepID=UPI001F0A3B32|nr:acetyltransferase [Pseudomonas psychrophila]